MKRQMGVCQQFDILVIPLHYTTALSAAFAGCLLCYSVAEVCHALCARGKRRELKRGRRAVAVVRTKRDLERRRIKGRGCWHMASKGRAVKAEH